MGVSDTDLSTCEPHLQAWLDQGMHGTMGYMARHGMARLDVNTILPGAIRIVSLRIPYVPESLLAADTEQDGLNSQLARVQEAQQPYISLYARGRDYHKVIRKRLQQWMDDVHAEVGPLGYRVTVDSAPTPEVEIARKAGLGWRGKHSLLVHPREGSMFFLAEVFTNLPLPLSGEFEQDHCGTCSSCVDACPTGAILPGRVVDARRCVSYLTIEHDAGIDPELRRGLGTRIYGCDDCQLVCPWNKFTRPAVHADFNARPHMNEPDWATLMCWTEADFLKHTEGSAIRRIGFWRFQRNLAVAAGNAQGEKAQLLELTGLLDAMKAGADEVLLEHIAWAQAELNQRMA